MNEAVNVIRERLFAARDEKYRDFISRLLPGISRDAIIGVRSPRMAVLAREIEKSQWKESFLSVLPHEYYEENGLHAYLISREKDPQRCMEALDRFLPFVDNWATCDSIRPRALNKDIPLFLDAIDGWMASSRSFTVRFGIEMLMTEFLDERFDEAYPQKVAAVRSEAYYVNMIIAWYFATALGKRYDDVIPYLENRVLPPWVHGKSIQKAVESRVIPDERKAYLKSLR